MKNIFYDGLNITPLTRAIFALVPLAVIIAIFAGVVWLVFLIGDVQPGWVHRWRPWLAFAVLWLLFGFGVRVLLGAMSSGMLYTPGIQLLATFVAWPLFAWWALAVI